MLFALWKSRVGWKRGRICRGGELSYIGNYSTTKWEEAKGPYYEAQGDKEDGAQDERDMLPLECCLYLLGGGLLRDNIIP